MTEMDTKLPPPRLNGGSLPPPNAVSQGNLMHNIESFGNLQTQATRNAGVELQTSPSAQESPSHLHSQSYMQMQSRHFNMTTPLNPPGKASGDIYNIKGGTMPRNPAKRKEVFFRSGKGQGLYKMTLNDSTSGDTLKGMPNVTDYKHHASGGVP